MQNRDLLTEAAQERRVREAAKVMPTRSLIDRGHAQVRRFVGSIAAADSTSRGTRHLAKAWR
jgi:hypothetical protein